MLDIALLSTNASQLKYVLQVRLLIFTSSGYGNWQNHNFFLFQVGEEHDYYTPMLVLIISSIVLQVSTQNLLVSLFCFPPPVVMKDRFNFALKVLNGLTQVLMGPLNLDKEEFKPFLNVVNYISMFLSYGIVGIDAIKAIFFPQTIFSAKK